MRKTIAIGLLAVAMLGACGGDGKDAAPQSGDEPEVVAGIEFVATDYGFSAPDTIAAGEQEITLRNDGEEPHELIIQQLTDDAPAIPEILEMPDKKSERFFVGETITSDRVKPGASVSLTVDLEPGRYGYVCFVSTDKSEMPHAFLGMHGEFTVN